MPRKKRHIHQRPARAWQKHHGVRYTDALKCVRYLHGLGHSMRRFDPTPFDHDEIFEQAQAARRERGQS